MITPIYECIINKKTTIKPVWFMRQAGRYLPEFRKIRKLNPDFINICLNKDLSSKITLQPLERFNLSAAIIFSDILIIPDSLGQKLEYVEGHGPKLKKMTIDEMLMCLFPEKSPTPEQSKANKKEHIL